MVQGQVNPDEFYVYKRALSEGKRAILRRGLGSKAVKMVYADAPQTGHSVRTIGVPEAERRRFSISDAEVEELAHYAMIIEGHYGRPMDIEWGKDGVDGKLYVLEARPETLKAGGRGRYAAELPLEQRSEVWNRQAIGQKNRQRSGGGWSRRPRRCRPCARGEVLVTDMQPPDWSPS